MLPRENAIKVTLEQDMPGTSRIQPAQTTQPNRMKILRRPQAVDKQRHEQQSLVRNPHGDLMNQTLLSNSNQPTNMTTGNAILPNLSATDQAPKCMPHASLSYSAVASRFTKRDSKSDLGQIQDRHQYNHSQTSKTLDQTAIIKQPSESVGSESVRLNHTRKTYQERADEYARARLRILGSAFPEYDDNDEEISDNNNICVNENNDKQNRLTNPIDPTR